MICGAYPPAKLLFVGILLPLSGAVSPNKNPFEVNSPWPSYHAGPSRQASTDLAGPSNNNNAAVQVTYFRDDTAGFWGLGREEFGTSPWHILSDTKYTNDATARSLWGSSLTHFYKYVITESSGLKYVDHVRLDKLPFFVSWNLMGLADGSIIVPAPNGFSNSFKLFDPCRTGNPALLRFGDGDMTDSPIRCVGKFEFTKQRLQQSCGFSDTVFGTTTVNSNVLLTGEIIVQLRRNVGGLQKQQRQTWLAVINREWTDIVSCVQVTEDGTASNGSPMEYGGSNSETIYYLPTETELIASVYNSATNTLTPRQASVQIGFRNGRTGTTPTLLDFETFQFILTVDSKCAVQNVFTGAIECDDSMDARPSELIAIPRPLESGPTKRVILPDFLETTENSPAVLDNHIVICNYSGYSPNGIKDGQPDRAVGLVKLSWNSNTMEFQVDWKNENLQCSGVPTISASSNLVYFSGTEEPDLDTYFYGLNLVTGAVELRVFVGKSEDGNFFTGDRGVYDAGNNIVINDDGSAIWPGGQNLVRISGS